MIARTSAAPRRFPTTWLTVAAIVTAGLLAFVVLVQGAGFDAATTGLVVSALTLMTCLRALYRMASTLGGTAEEIAFERDVIPTRSDLRRLRDERRRLLRAINELKFDYEMGKLSDTDYREVRQGYELRAVEVMRALDTDGDLDPELRDELLSRGIDIPGEAAADESDAEVPAGNPATAASETPKPPEVETQDASATGASAPAGAEPQTAASGVTDQAKPELSCASCDGANDGDAKFCKHCGKELM